MIKLYLVRHGQTKWNKKHLLAGWTDIALNEKGKEQARAISPCLKEKTFDSVFSSDLCRAVETARLAFGNPRQDKRLREINFGDLEGHLWDELDIETQVKMNEFKDVSIPGGESMEEFKKRIFDFIFLLEDGCHLLFTHGGVIRVLSQNLGYDKFAPNGSVIEIDWTRQKLLKITEQ